MNIIKRAIIIVLCVLIAGPWFFSHGTARAEGNDAQFISEAGILDVVTPGQVFTVSITMQNTGSTTWTTAESYRLGSQAPQDNTNWGIGRVAITGLAVEPGQTHVFSFSVKAPTTPGVYDFEWQMLREGVEWFGDMTPDIAINVGNVTPPPPTGSICDDSFHNDQFYACFFDGVDPSTSQPALIQHSAITVPSPVGSWAGFKEDWGGGVVDSTGKIDEVSAIYNGRVNFQAGTYVFHAAGDDGVKLGLMGNQNILLPNSGVFSWSDHGYTQFDSAPVTLPAGYQTLDLSWYENGGGARISLSWDLVTTPRPPSPGPDDAEFISQTVPATVQGRQEFTTTITFKNVGTTTWTSDKQYSLGAQNPQDSHYWRDGRVRNQANNIAPGQEVTFTFTNKAHGTLGTFNFQWQMVSDAPGGVWFGDKTPNIAIDVLPETTTAPVIASLDRTTIPQGGILKITGANFDPNTGGFGSNMVWFYQPDGTFLGGVAARAYTENVMYINVPYVGDKGRGFVDPGEYILKVSIGEDADPSELLNDYKITPPKATLSNSMPLTVISQPAVLGAKGVLEGHFGHMAYNSKSNNFLVVVNNQGRIVRNDGSSESDPFTVDDSTVYFASPKVAYSPDINKFLVVWTDFTNTYGKFVNPNGRLSGGVFKITQPGPIASDAGFPQQLSYDGRNKKFVMMFGYQHAALITIGNNRSLGRIFKLVPGPGATVLSAPEFTINEEKNEYCLVYNDWAGPPGGVAMRSINPQSGALGKVSHVTTDPFDAISHVVYNSVNKQYLVVWTQGYNMGGKILNSCDGQSGKKFKINFNGWSAGSNVAYNPKSNSYAIEGNHWQDGQHAFIALSATGKETRVVNIFLDGRKGNWVSEHGLVANTKDGTFAAIASRNLELTRIVTKLKYK